MSSQNTSDISVVIVHYRTEELLARCLENLYKSLRQSGLNHEVFVVDNGSAFREMEPIQRAYPQVRWISKSNNEGFAKAANEGLHLAKGAYCLLLNPDCFVSPNSIGHLVAALRADPRIGIGGGRHTCPDGKLQPSARAFPTPWNVFTDQLLLDRLFPRIRLFNRYRMGGWQHDQKREVDQLMGSCLLIRRTMLEQIGYLDERFFLYFEEVDLCWRAKNAGWKITFFPDPRMEVMHVGGASSRLDLTHRYIHRYQSLTLWYRKHFARPWVWVIKGFILIGICLRLLMYQLMGKKGLFSAHLAALKKWHSW